MKKIILVFLTIFLASTAFGSINVITGNLSYQQEIFSVNSAPMSLQFILNYNSFDRLDGSLGMGWGHNYNLYLHENSDGTMVLTGGGNKRFYSRVSTTVGKGKNKTIVISYVPQAGDYSSLEKNLDNTWTLTLRSGLTYQFGIDNKLSSITDRYGNTITVDNALAGQTTITDASGRVLVIYFDTEGKISSFTDPAQRAYNFDYHTDSGLLWTVSYPAPDFGESQPVHEFLYTTDGLLEYRIDPEGHITKYEYDSRGRVIRTIDPDGVIDIFGNENAAGHSKTLEYDVPFTYQTTVTEKDNGTWVYTYDKTTGLLTSKVEPDGDETIYTYYPPGHEFDGLLQEKFEPVDSDSAYITTHVAYDTFGNLLEKTGHARHFTVQKNGRVRESNDPVDMHMAYTYDNDNEDRLTSVSNLMVDPALVTSFVYDFDALGGEQLNIIDPAGKQVSYYFNDNGSLKEIIGPYGVLLSNQYHANGDLSSTTNSSGVKTELLNYDAMGNPSVVKVTGTDGSSQETHLGYDDLTRLTTITKQGIVLDASGVPSDLVTQFSYDKVGNRQSVLDAEQKLTTYGYNYKGQVASITDAYLEETELIYSGSGCGTCGSGVNKLIGVIDANHSGGDPSTAPKTTFAYYPDGKLKSETDQLGNKILYTYYPMGWLMDKRLDSDGDGEPSESDLLILQFAYYPDGKIQSKLDGVTGQVTEFTYGPEGWLNTANNPHIGYTFEYYPNGWLKKITDTNGRVVSYDAYDDLGQRDLVTVLPGTTDQKILDYAYDGSGRLQTIASESGIFSFGYDAHGRRDRLTYPNGLIGSYNYRPKTDWLTVIKYVTGSSAPVVDIQYPAHDKVGNRKERSEDGVPTTYTYDDVYRLLAVSSTEPESYSYDPVGNRESGPTALETELSSYDYDTANRMLLGRKDTYVYDVFGNQKFRYIDANQSNFWEYTWDGDNRMIKAELKSAGALLRSVSFKYDPFGRRTEKSVTESGTAIKYSYVYDGEDIVLEYVNNGASTSLVHYIHGPGIDEPLAMARNGQPSYYHADGLGSIVAITDASGNIVQRYSYEAFGQHTASDPTFDNFYTYTGREYDKETGLYYYRARYYDAMEGRFISKDPIGFAGGDVNLYNYVGGNPINYADPFGLYTEVGVRDFYPTPVPYAKHCFVRYNGNDSQTQSFSPSGISPDPNPSGADYSSTTGPENDACVEKEMNTCQSSDYDFLEFNCCDCVSNALYNCGLSKDGPWPNWPADSSNPPFVPPSRRPVPEIPVMP